MQRKSISFKNSVLFKMIITLIFCFIPIIAGCIVIINDTQKNIAEQRSQVLGQQLIVQKQRLEEMVSKIYNSQMHIVSTDTEISKLAINYSSIGAFELGQSVANIHKTFTFVRNLSAIVDNVSIYMPTINREISTKDYYNDNVASYTKEIFSAIISDRSRLMYCFDNRLYVAAIPNYLYAQNIKYLLYSELDKNRVQEFLDMPGTGFNFFIYKNDAQLSPDNILNTDTVSINRLKNLPEEDGNIQYFKSELNDNPYIIASQYSKILGCFIVSYSEESVIKSSFQESITNIVIIAVAMLFVFLWLIKSYYANIKKPLNKLLATFDEVQNGNLDVQIAEQGQNEFSVLIHFFNVMIKRLKDIIDEVYVKNLNLKKAELQRLQAQISPHFLYNSFAIISHSINIGKNDAAQKMTSLLCNYFKFITDNKSDVESLENEFKFARIYVDIQTIRFGDRIKIIFSDLPQEIKNLKVPKMIIQPLIENAYKHAFKDTEENGVLQLGCEINDNSVYIFVEDNGCGMSADELNELKNSLALNEIAGHDGLLNVHNRLKIMYNNNQGLTIESNENISFRVSFQVPLEEI